MDECPASLVYTLYARTHAWYFPDLFRPHCCRADLTYFDLFCRAGLTYFHLFGLISFHNKAPWAGHLTLTFSTLIGRLAAARMAQYE